MSTQPSFEEVVNSGNLKEVKKFLDNDQSNIVVSEDPKILQYILENKCDIKILQEVLGRLKDEVKDKVINRADKNRKQTLFLALYTGADYLKAFENDQYINWSVFDKKGNNLLHYALSMPNISNESLDLIHKKLDDSKCLLVTNNDGENALHCAARSGNLTNFKWCLDQYRSDQIKLSLDKINNEKTTIDIESLLNSVNRLGETPVVELLKNKNLGSNEPFKEIIKYLSDNNYDFLKTDHNEQNAVSLAVKNGYYSSINDFLTSKHDATKERREEIAFSVIENNQKNLSTFASDITQNNVKESLNFAKKYPKRFANLISNSRDDSILFELIKDKKLTNQMFTDDDDTILHLAIKHKNYNLADQCLKVWQGEEYYSLHNKNKQNVLHYFAMYGDQPFAKEFLDKAKNIDPGLLNLLTESDSTGKTPLHYAAENNPEVFTELVKKLPEYKLNILFQNGIGQEVAQHKVSQENSNPKITTDIAKSFSQNNDGWYDTAGILASLADLIIEKKADDPIILVQPHEQDDYDSTSKQQPLSNELKEISKLSNNQDVLYVRRDPTNANGKSRAHWIVFYFFQNNLLIVDPFGSHKPSKVVRDAVKGTIDNVYVSTTNIQHDVASCGPISSEVTRAIHSNRAKLKGLLSSGDTKIDITKILPDGLIDDAKKFGKVNYGQGDKNFQASKIRNTHVRIAQTICNVTFDSTPSQNLLRSILTKGGALAEQTAMLGHDSIEQIYQLCQKNKNISTKKVVSILNNKEIANLDFEVALLLAQNEIAVNQQQIEKLDKTLGEDFKEIKKRLDNALQPKTLQLSDEQINKIKNIRKQCELDLKDKLNKRVVSSNSDSLLDSFLRSASADDVKAFFSFCGKPESNLNDKIQEAAFTAARSGKIDKLQVLVNHNNDILYTTDVSGKSLLEAAAENSHPEVVQYIIREHNKIHKNKDNEKPEFLGFINNIAKRNDPWAKDLARVLNKVSHNKDYNESDESEIKKILSPDKWSNEAGKTVDKNDYGKLQYYADVIKRGNVEEFKTLLEKNSKPEHRLFSLNDNGYSLVTLTAALGTVDHWKEIEKAYGKIQGRSAYKASLDNKSSIGSPIQAALIAGNLQVFYHLFDLKDGFKIDKQYGAEENNILHTILQSGKVELFNDIFFKFKNKDTFFKALQQVNKDKKSPLDLALEKGHHAIFNNALDLIVSRNKKDIANLLISNDCGLARSAVKFDNKNTLNRIFSLQDEYNKSSDKQLNLLEHNNRYNEKERTTINALTASISSDSYNKEIFDLLFNQGINFRTFSEIDRYSPVHKAAKYNNIGALQYFIKKFPNDNILDIKNKDGKTSLHYAIKNGNREVAEFLIKNGANFNLSNHKGITPFELALQNSKFSDICINLLDHNEPGATLPFHRAILSGNESLIEKLIDKKYWLFDQYNNNSIKNSDILDGETALKLALRKGISKDLTSELAYKLISRFNELDKKQQILESGFLNDILKSGIYDSEDLTKLDEANKFFESEITKDKSLLNVVSQGTTLLYDIASKGNTGLFEKIKDYIDPNIITSATSNEFKEAPLHVAVRNGNTYIVKVLLEKLDDNFKFAVNQYNAEGYTPFQIAAESGNKEVYELLKDNDGDLESRTKNGDSIAHLLVLSAMESIDPKSDCKYEYEKWLKEPHLELGKLVNHRGDDLLATAAKCSNKDAAPKIIKQLLENEFKHKKNQFTQENAVRLLSNAILAGNFNAVSEIVFENIKRENTLTSKIADVTGKIYPSVGHTIFPSSQKKIANIKEEKALSQSILKALLSTEEKKKSLSQTILKFLPIVEQKGLSQPITTINSDALCDFLIEDQNLSNIDNFPLVEEEVRVSNSRKNIIVQQEELRQKIDTFLEQKQSLPLWKNERKDLKDVVVSLKNNQYTFKINESIIHVINNNNSTDNIVERACGYYFQQNPDQNPDECLFGDVTRKQYIIKDIESVFNDNNKQHYIDFILYAQQLQEQQTEESRAKIIEDCAQYMDKEYDKLRSDLYKCNQQISELDKKIAEYGLNKDYLYKIKTSKDALYTSCKALEGKSIIDDIFTNNNSNLIKLILKDEELWDHRFVDSKGNTLLHKIGQMDSKFISLDLIKKLTDRGFSLIKKNNDGKSARDILEDACHKLADQNNASAIINHLINAAQTEEKVQEHFEKGLDSLLENNSISYLKSISLHEHYGQLFNKYYGTVFNPFHSIVSSCFNGDLSNDYLFKKKLQSFDALLKSKDLSSALDKTDEKRSNFLHKAIEEAITNYDGTNKMLDHILLNVAKKLNDNRNFELCNRLFFKQRNSEGDNVIEALSKVPGSLDIFKKLEGELSTFAFAKECDLNLVLINAARNKNCNLYTHVTEEYRLNRLRTPNENDQFPLHAAVISGDQETVLAVLKSGANINQINADGKTALHELLISLNNSDNSINLARYLAARGAFFGQEEIDVIKSVDDRDKVLLGLAQGRSDFHNLKYKLLKRVGDFITSKNKSDAIDINLDVGGSVVFIKVTNGIFRSNEFLNSDICGKNNLTTSYFDIDGSKGYVQKSSSGARNYVVSEDNIKLNVWWTHPNDSKGSIKESITVYINADGTIKASDKDLKKYGGIGDDQARKKAVEQLVEKVDFEDNTVYVGGIPLKDALTAGRWRDQSLNEQKQAPHKKVERVQSVSSSDSPSHNSPSFERSRHSSSDTEEIIEEDVDEQKNISDQIDEDLDHQILDSREIEDNGQELASYTQATQGEEIVSEGMDDGLSNKVENNKENNELNNNVLKLIDSLNSPISEIEENNNASTKLIESTRNVTESLTNLITEATNDWGNSSFQGSKKDQKELINQSINRSNMSNSNGKSSKYLEELKEKHLKTSKKNEIDKSGVIAEHLDRDAENFKYQVKADDVTASTYKHLAEGGIKLPESLKEKTSHLSELGELEKRFKQPNKGLKKHTKEYYISPKTKEKLGNLLDNKIDDKYLEDKVSKKVESQTSSSKEIPNVEKQQAEKLTDEKKKNFYKAVEDVTRSLAGVMNEVENNSNSKQQKDSNNRTTLKLNLINLNDNMHINSPGSSIPRSPDSGYGSPINSPKEEKGEKDSLESEKQGRKNVDLSGEVIESGKKHTPTMVKEYKPELNKVKVIKKEDLEKIIQEIRKNLPSSEKTKNHMGTKASEKLKFGLSPKLREGNNQSLPPIPSSGNNKGGFSR